MPFPFLQDSLRGSSFELGTIQRRLVWPLRKDDTHKSRSVIILNVKASVRGIIFSNHEHKADPDSRKGRQKASTELAGLAPVPSRLVPDLLARGR
jgi:hypothetical protein